MTATEQPMFSVEQLFEEIKDSPRFELQELMGHGAYSVVCSAFDNQTQMQVCIKKIYNWMSDTKEAMRTLREVQIMKHFAGSLYVLNLIEVLPSDTTEDYKHLFVISERMDSDLHSFIETNAPIVFKERISILEKIARGLSELHKAKIIHRDLRDKNVLVTWPKIVLCDFGMSRGLNIEPVGLRLSLLEYTTRSSYSPPEGLLGSPKYTSAVDIWSLGCILVELISGKSMLQKIKEFSDSENALYLEVALRITGIPSTTEIKNCKMAAKFKHTFAEALDHIKKDNLVFNDLREFIPEATDAEIHLLKKIFVFSASKRITASGIVAEIESFADYEPQGKTNNFSEFRIQEKKLKHTKKEDVREAMNAFISYCKKDTRPISPRSTLPVS